jgi:hypothetical protein
MAGCGNCGGNCNGSCGVPSSTQPLAVNCLSSGSILSFCSPTQPPLPQPLPDDIPDTNIVTGQFQPCSNGNPVPVHPADCDNNLNVILDDLKSSVYCVLNAITIAGTTGSCNLLTVVNGSVKVKSLMTFLEECLTCLQASKICPGNNGDVLQTIGGKTVWSAPAPPVIPPLTCSQISPVLAKDACIIPGGSPKYVIGYGSSTNSPEYYPYLDPNQPNCARFNAEFSIGGTGCLTQDTSPATYGLGVVAGKPVVRPLPASSTPFIANCSDLVTQLGACPPTKTDAVTSVLSNGASGLGYRPLPTSGTTLTCATIPVTTDTNPGSILVCGTSGNIEKIDPCTATLKNLVNCPPTETTVCARPTKVLGQDSTNNPKWYVGSQPYHLEVLSGSTSETFPNTFNTLNNIVAGWNSFWESGLCGQSSQWNSSTGRWTCARKGMYSLKFSGFFNVIIGGGSALAAHIYAGLTIVRAAGTWQGASYPAFAAVHRAQQATIYGDGIQKDFNVDGSIIMPLNVGDAVWARVVVTNAPSVGTTLSLLRFREDGGASLVIHQLPDTYY